jgi:hypothetical protein
MWAKGGSLKFCFLTLLLLFAGSKKLYAQEDWVDLVMERSGQTIALSMDLSMYESRPNYKNFVLIGTEFSPCMPNGFPVEESLDHLFAFSDESSAVLDSISKNRLVAIMTYDCKGFDLYYAKDTLGLRRSLHANLQKKFPGNKYQVFIKTDKNWVDYYKKLYPQDLSDDHLMDKARLHEMLLMGDDLENKRSVRHWLMFKTLKDRNRTAKRLERFKFSLDSIGYFEERYYPFELQVSREDYIKPDSLAKLTMILKLLSQSSNGVYDGWDTPTIIKKEP